MKLNTRDTISRRLVDAFSSCLIFLVSEVNVFFFSYFYFVFKYSSIFPLDVLFFQRRGTFDD